MISFSVTASSSRASLVASWTPPFTDSWTSPPLTLGFPWIFSFFSFKLATTTCKIRVMFLLKMAFSSSHSKGSRWRRLTYFPVNSAAMVAMPVKLLLVFTASNTSRDEFFEMQVRPPVVNTSLLIFPPFFCSLFFSARLSIFPNARWKLPFQVF